VSDSGIVAIVCHDAGGAEILASYVAQNKVNCKLVLEGPAINVFKRRFGAVEAIPLEAAILSCDWCLCSTGWQSDLEWHAIEQAKNAGKRVVAFLDHWVNYKERFIRNGAQHLPDEIWVGDEDAERIAQAIFHELPVVLKPNPYFLDLQLALENLVPESRDSAAVAVLYVCEPVREPALLQYGDERYWGYTEEEALQFFLKNINVLGLSVDAVKIRPHPSESKNKYDWAKQLTDLTLTIGGDKTLWQEIVDADLVVGCESMAMVVGLLAHKKIISSIPPSGKPCGLPHEKIVYLRDLVLKQQEELLG
jgi:hypothetical protein